MRFPALREVLGLYLAATVVTVVVMQLRALPVAGELTHVIIGGVFLFGALRMARRDARGAVHYGLALEGLLARTDAHDDEPLEPLSYVLPRALPSALREAGFVLAVAAVIFPPFAFAFAWWHGAAHPFRLALPADLASFAATQLFVVALPEEAFFRGYVQTRLEDDFTRKTRVLGADVSLPALVLQAALFGLIHAVVDLDAQRLSVFFPGLLFGWMRARRGGIGASLFMHALCNVYADILMRGWLLP